MDPRRMFQVEDEEIDATTHLVRLDGEVDAYTVPEFRELVVELMESGKKRFLIDLSQATVLDDSPILRVLTRTVKSGGGSAALVCADESVRRAFAITGLDRVFPIYSTRDEALTGFGVRTSQGLEGGGPRPGRSSARGGL